MLGALLLLAGCSSVSIKEHELAPGEAPHLALKAFWRPTPGEPLLVGGLRCRLSHLDPKAGEPREAVTKAGQPLRFLDLAPGVYSLEIETLARWKKGFVLDAGRRVTIRLDLEALAREERGEVGPVHVLREGARYTLLGLALGTFLVIDSSLDDDEDEEDYRQDPERWSERPGDPRRSPR
ncbi:MAG TPA: hypothetical protein DEA08_34130 [Planctomycetes bacterium]|nr:hypothetical protein [Planctomycetota bacterium]